MNRAFSQLASYTSHIIGKPITFVLACVIILIWGAFGPYTNYSDTWQLWANTGTTLFSFVVLILIQHTQNRDTAAIQLKLNELILVNRKASNVLLDVDKMTEAELKLLYASMHERMEKQARRTAAKADKQNSTGSDA